MASIMSAQRQSTSHLLLKTNISISRSHSENNETQICHKKKVIHEEGQQGSIFNTSIVKMKQKIFYVYG
jgi:hypothetical protein